MPTKLINVYPYVIPSFKTNDLISTQEVRIRLLFIFFSIISSFSLSTSPSSSILTSQFYLTASIHLSSLSINAAFSPLPDKVRLPVIPFQDTPLVFLIPIALAVTHSEASPSLDRKSHIVKATHLP